MRGSLKEPARLKPGEKVTEAGVYDVGMAAYHNDICPGPSISGSGINTLLNETARAYFHDSPYNPNRAEEDTESAESAGFRIGRGAHTLAFEPHLFASHYVIRPSRFTSWQTDASKDWRTEQQREGLTVFTPKELAQVHGIVASLKEHPLIQQGLLDGYCERSLFWKDEETGVWLKIRPDAIPELDATICANLKCLTQITPRQIWRQTFDHGYHVGAALVTMGIEAVLGMKVSEYALVFVGQRPPHDILIAPLDPTSIEWGRRLVRKGIRIFARCLEQNYWPSYDALDNEYLKPSEYMINQWAKDPDMK